MNAHSARSRVLAVGVIALAVPMAGLVGGATAGAAGGTGTVTGTVLSSSTGKPLKNICINVVEATGDVIVNSSAPTTKTGVWTVTGVSPSGDLTAFAFECSKGDYVGQWYDNEDFQTDADQFPVTAGTTTSGIDFSLAPGGAISGKVTDAATKKGISGVLVIADWTTAYQTSGAVCTSANGSYKISGLATSGVKLEFIPGACGGSTAYSTAWYGGVDYSSATLVPVTVDRTTSKINQALSS